MRGTLLGYDAARGEGVISGSDEQRYRFAGIEFKGEINRLRPGIQLDFDVQDGAALEVYPFVRRGTAGAVSSLNDGTITESVAAGFSPPSVSKSHVTAGILALLFGGLGLHKFYMGYLPQGWILLGATILSYLLVIAVIGIVGLFAVGLICLVEAIILLTKDQSEFEEIYLTGHHPWF